MIKAKLLDYNGVKYGTKPNTFLTGGYVFDLTPNLKSLCDAKISL
jgi:hypothetical protein